MTLIEFECRGHRFALPLACVRRVVLSAKPTALPGAPDIVLGVLNVAGDIVTVVDFCGRIGLHQNAIDISQRLLIIQVSGFPIGFIVDFVHGVAYRELTQAKCVPSSFAGADFVESIVQMDDGLCIIVDPEKFLFEDEISRLGDALEKALDERC